MRTKNLAILAVTPFLSWACATEGAVEERDEPGAISDDGEGSPYDRGGTAPCANCGEPLAGLDEEHLAAFEVGLEDFSEEEEVEDGLGPVFNEIGCASCHDTPATGGSGTTLETRFGIVGDDGVFDAMPYAGGSLRQDHGIGELGTCGLAAEITPVDATVVAGRRTTPLFGLGLVDAVPDIVLQFIAAAQPASIRGVPHWLTDIASGQRRIGRFGWKAQVATVRTFSGDAYLNEMGITSPDFPVENCPQGDCDRLVDCDALPDPEDDGESITKFTDFMSLLAAPEPRPLTATARRGERLFRDIGCAGCHVPTLVTGSSPVPQLDHVTLHPFSDFLLHDMGALGDGITQGLATGRLMRTAPLWGVSAQPFLLHDGRATTLGEAIRAHAGQGQRSRDRFVQLSRSDRQALIAFLQSL